MKRLASRSTWRTLPPSMLCWPLDEAQTKELGGRGGARLGGLATKGRTGHSPPVRGHRGTPQTLNEIGAVFGLTRERIRPAAALSRLARARLANSRNQFIDT